MITSINEFRIAVNENAGSYVVRKKGGKYFAGVDRVDSHTHNTGVNDTINMVKDLKDAKTFTSFSAAWDEMIDLFGKTKKYEVLNKDEIKEAASAVNESNTEYTRVIPRDLFNEAKLLKCFGQLSLKIHDNVKLPAVMEIHHDGTSFDVAMVDDCLTVNNIEVSVNGLPVLFKTKYNSKNLYPMYAEHLDVDYRVFDDNGQFDADFIDLCNTLKGRVQESSVNEGCWALPQKVEQATALKTLVDKLENDPAYIFPGIGGHGPTPNKDEFDLYNLMGDDGLFDQIGMMEEPTNQKIADAIKECIQLYVAAYEKNPAGFTEPFDDKALKILKTI